ncbi:MAG: MBL fold hydrolase [Flavobacteriales bacterium CG18_big_fil_WC_8_21_14_2_50_32_9]|nr:MAG: MBL fold hydrolase [Flavobacteriales bacterium CG18_big_fil_WC_8_21_14_2_50_32_9]PJC62323.1 MAG: MBL fold hydrolase [Flavobacteriales bacterium CG_4_9_14_0_2_um_filter_32_27]
MLNVHIFSFNGFQENTYVLFDETNECVIIDPGCYSVSEQNELTNFIDKKNLTPVKLLNTHCHIDHMLGNNFVAKKYNLGLEIHRADLPTLLATTEYGHLYGFTVDPSPYPSNFIDETSIISFGNTELEVRFTPGHAPGHVVFINHLQKFIINGDVLFLNSIGRTDLPGGDFETLINSISTQLFTLPDDYTIYTGHGPSTTIGNEKKFNPFVKQ